MGNKSMFIQEAFNLVANGNDKRSYWVTIGTSTQQYGGAEEGGWYWNEIYYINSVEVPSLDAAFALRDYIESLAEELQKGSLVSSLSWKSDRQLDNDWKPKSDYDDIHVWITDYKPKNWKQVKPKWE